MRIISGKRKGLKLFSPKGEGTRPTEDRIKENLFNLLGLLKENAKVLDAFAGTGSLGLEALSRGAEIVDFFETDPKTAEVLKKNYEKVNLKNGGKIYQKDVIKFLSDDKNIFFYDYVFLDPPYSDVESYKLSLLLLQNKGMLNEDGLVIIERSIDISIFIPEKFELIKSKRYRDTIIEILKFVG